MGKMEVETAHVVEKLLIALYYFYNSHKCDKHYEFSEGCAHILMICFLTLRNGFNGKT